MSDCILHFVLMAFCIALIITMVMEFGYKTLMLAVIYGFLGYGACRALVNALTILKLGG